MNRRDILNTLVAITASLATTAASLTRLLAAEDGVTLPVIKTPEPPAQDAEPPKREQAEPAPPKRKRGRPRKMSEEAATTTEEAATTTEEAATTTEEAATTTEGQDLDGLRRTIAPAVKAGKGAEVKKLIAEAVGKEGATLAELVEMPEKHAAFAKAINNLL